MSVNGLHRNRVSGMVRVSVRDSVRACRPDSSGNLLTQRKMEFALKCLTLTLCTILLISNVFPRKSFINFGLCMTIYDYRADPHAARS